MISIGVYSGEDGGARGGGAGVGIADDQGGETDAALPEAMQKFTPVDFSFRQGDGDAQNEAAAIDLADADGDEDGAAADGSLDPDFFIAGVEQNMAYGIEGPGAPLLKEGIELGGDAADFGGGDGGAAEFFEDGGDSAGGTGAQRR